MSLNEKTSVALAQLTSSLYKNVALPVIKRRFNPENSQTGANPAHEQIMRLSEVMDDKVWAQVLLQKFYELVHQPQEGEVLVGGVTLPSDLILAAGWVKGVGFASEEEAMSAVEFGENIIPGFGSMHKLVGGAIEFGSYTRYPRMGNDHPSMWRLPNGSVQNRVGLTNPGVLAAAEFLSKEKIKSKLPPVFGINIAVSPGVTSEKEELTHVKESIEAFLQKGIFPQWFTLNISCPNTEDDPEGNQTDAKVRKLCLAALWQIGFSGQDIPLWVKVSPGLGYERYAQLMKIFSELGIKAVIGTNTRGEPAPNDPTLTAGISGRALHLNAVEATYMLSEAKKRLNILNVDVIGCGGVEDGASYLDFSNNDVAAAQYLTALLFRGPTASVLIKREAELLKK